MLFLILYLICLLSVITRECKQSQEWALREIEQKKPKCLNLWEVQYRRCDNMSLSEDLHVQIVCVDERWCPPLRCYILWDGPYVGPFGIPQSRLGPQDFQGWYWRVGFCWAQLLVSLDQIHVLLQISTLTLQLTRKALRYI
jgi:hypothetical protein